MISNELSLKLAGFLRIVRDGMAIDRAEAGLLLEEIGRELDGGWTAVEHPGVGTISIPVRRGKTLEVRGSGMVTRIGTKHLPGDTIHVPAGGRGVTFYRWVENS